MRSGQAPNLRAERGKLRRSRLLHRDRRQVRDAARGDARHQHVDRLVGTKQHGAELQRVVVINLAAVGLSALGLAAVVTGILLG